MPNAVAQKRNTTLAAETIAGRSAGRVTDRNTCHGVAPRVAAAWPGRGSRDSQAAPTTRITTATLKNTSPATMATAVWSRPRNPSGPASPSSCRKATPTTTVGSTNGTSRTARTARRPGRSRRYNTCAAGRPSSTAIAVPAAADQTVNQSTRCTRGRASTSRTPPGSNSPSGQKPWAIIPTTGSTKNTPSAATGTRERAARPESRRITE